MQAATDLLEKLHVLAAEAGLGKLGELVAGSRVVQDDLEDFGAEEIGQSAGGGAVGFSLFGDGTSLLGDGGGRGDVKACLFDGTEDGCAARVVVGLVGAIPYGPLAVVGGRTVDGTAQGTLGRTLGARVWLLSSCEVRIVVGGEVSHEAIVAARSCSPIIGLHDDASRKEEGWRG